jgi:GntR family transcriptional regulator
MADLRRVDRTLYEPSYIQLVRIIQEQIASGELKPGDRLPSESQLCKHHGVSPMTVRRAVERLVKEGSVITQRGRGTFVKSMQFWETTFRIDNLQRFFTDSDNTNIKILECSIIPADRTITNEMTVNVGQRIVFMRRLISIDNKPFIYHVEYLLYDPKSPIIEAELEVTSLKGLFEGSNNLFLKKSNLRIEAAILNEDESSLLKAPYGSPAFHLEHVFYDYNDQPVSWGRFICPGDRIRFTTETGVGNKERDIR